MPTALGRWPYTVTVAWPLAVEAGILVVHDTGADPGVDPGVDPGDLVGLRASDGAMLWRMQLNFQTVTVHGGIIYVGASDAVLAVRLANGGLIWRTPLDGAPFSAPLLVGSSLFTSRSGGAVIALRADTGTVLWDHAFDTEGVGSLPLGAIAGWLYVYVPSNVQCGVDSGLLRLNPVSGVDPGYELRLPGYVEALHPALQTDIFYAVIDSVDMSVTTPSELAAYRLSSTGSQLLWRRPLPDHPAYEITYDAETAYVRTLARSGTISAYHLSDGELWWRRQALMAARLSIAAGDGEAFEATYGMIAPCRTPPIHQAPQIRAYANADGGAIWTRDLDDKL
ncbi:MAG TPA: PQQ-binding-like beta-propeller repeat protein [Ktedonobacterales bacterium]